MILKQGRTAGRFDAAEGSDGDEQIAARGEGQGASKDLPSLAYTSAREKIAEKFHMSQDLLQALNPGQKFETAGDTIVVAKVAA